jgi:RNA polymerase primary sigma factor
MKPKAASRVFETREITDRAAKLVPQKMNESRSWSQGESQEFPDETEQTEIRRVSSPRVANSVTSTQGADALPRYLKEMSGHGLLTAETELLAAYQVEHTEILHWAALLSYTESAPLVLNMIQQSLASAPEAERPTLPELGEMSELLASFGTPEELTEHVVWRRKAELLGEKLRTWDPDRELSNRATELVLKVLSPRPGSVPPAGAEPSPRERYRRRVQASQATRARAVGRFAEANLRLVVAVARRYKNARLGLADLIQEGNVGLLKAVHRFDHRRGCRFATYAAWWIRHAIGRALADKGRTVRIPAHLGSMSGRVNRATRSLSARLGHEPTFDEIEAETGISKKTLEQMTLATTRSTVSLEYTPDAGEGDALKDRLADESALASDEQVALLRDTEQLRRALPELREVHAQVLAWRFGLHDEEELTLEEIGKRWNLSRERVRQIQVRALKELREKLGG